MDQFVGRIEVLADPPALAHRVAEWMTATALTEKGCFRVALSGGSTPKALYSLLASEEFRDRFPWRGVSWFWGDERFVPYDHPESNYRMTRGDAGQGCSGAIWMRSQRQSGWESGIAALA